MISTDENINMLSRAVLGDAHGDAEQILADAKAKAEEIRNQAQIKAVAERNKILEQASIESERIRRQVVSIAQLNARTKELEEREMLIEEVFESARQKISTIQNSPDYDQIAKYLLREGLARLAGLSVRIRADENTLRCYPPNVLEEISKEMKVSLQTGENLRKGTGVIVETEDGHRQYDNTLETRLRRLQDTLRSSVYHILMGESL